MIPILCLDNKKTLNFFGKRLSFDRELLRHICAKIHSQNLHLNQYSAELFQKYAPEGCKPNVVICTSDEIQEMQGNEDGYLFLENKLPSPKFWQHCQEIWIYEWNRHYPQGQKFVLENYGRFELVESEEFIGYSHPHLTFNVYRRPNTWQE